MSRYLVVYYSRTGHTEQVARALAEKLGADLEPIRETENRRGILGYIRAAYHSVTDRLPDVPPASHDLQAYDMVILGSPVWASRPATPMRAFLAANRPKLKAIACFVTLGGSGAAKTLERMADAAGLPAQATFSATEGELKSGAWKQGMDRFVDAVVRTG